MNIIGREKEIEELEKRYTSNDNEFVAVTGEVGVGKTFLISQLFHERITFHHTAIPPSDIQNSYKGKMKTQLDAFYESLTNVGFITSKFKSWWDALLALINFLKTKDKNERILIFIDEIPWMDTPKSTFISAFEWFWNLYGANQSNLMMIISGSSISWMSKKIINSHGGLYDRITDLLYLNPIIDVTN